MRRVAHPRSLDEQDEGEDQRVVESPARPRWRLERSFAERTADCIAEHELRSKAFPARLDTSDDREVRSLPVERQQRVRGCTCARLHHHLVRRDAGLGPRQPGPHDGDVNGPRRLFGTRVPRASRARDPHENGGAPRGSQNGQRFYTGRRPNGRGPRTRDSVARLPLYKSEATPPQGTSTVCVPRPALTRCRPHETTMRPPWTRT